MHIEENQLYILRRDGIVKEGKCNEVGERLKEKNVKQDWVKRNEEETI